MKLPRLNGLRGRSHASLTLYYFLRRLIAYISPFPSVLAMFSYRATYVPTLLVKMTTSISVCYRLLAFVLYMKSNKCYDRYYPGIIGLGHRMQGCSGSYVVSRTLQLDVQVCFLGVPPKIPGGSRDCGNKNGRLGSIRQATLSGTIGPPLTTFPSAGLYRATVQISLNTRRREDID